MDLETFAKKLGRDLGQLRNHLNRRVPGVAGQELVNFFKRNYRRGGYEDGGFHAWKVTKRQLSGMKGAEGKYLPLHSRRNALFSAIAYKTGDGWVSVFNNTPYADIHNDGGTIIIRLTDKMRRFFWAMYYKANGIRRTTGGKGRKKAKTRAAMVAEQYKWMALTKRKTFTVRIPQRKFIYDCKEVRGIVKELVKKEVVKFLKM